MNTIIMGPTSGVYEIGNVVKLVEIEWVISGKRQSFSVVTAVPEGYCSNTLMYIVPLSALYFVLPSQYALLSEQNNSLKLCLAKERTIALFAL